MSSVESRMSLLQPGAYTSTGAIIFYSNMWVISATRTSVALPIPKCYLKHITINIFGNTLVGGGVTITFYKNASTVGSSVSWASGETGAKTITLNDYAEENDVICLEVNVAGTSGYIQFGTAGVHYE